MMFTLTLLHYRHAIRDCHVSPSLYSDCVRPAIQNFDWPQVEAFVILIDLMVLALARMFRLQLNIYCVKESHVRITFNDLHDMTNQLLKSPKSEFSCQSGGQQCSCMYENMPCYGGTFVFATFSPSIG